MEEHIIMIVDPRIKKTIEKMIAVKAAVLAIESGKTLMLDKPAMLELANQNDVCIYGIE